MRYIDRTGCGFHDKGKEKEIRSMGALTKEAVAKADAKGLGLLKTFWGIYRIISASGFGAGIMEDFRTLAEVDEYIKKHI